MALNRPGRAPHLRPQDTSSPWRTIAMIAVVLALGTSAFIVSGSGDLPACDSRSKPEVDVKFTESPMLGIAVETKQPVVRTMRLPVDPPSSNARPETAMPAN